VKVRVYVHDLLAVSSGLVMVEYDHFRGQLLEGWEVIAAHVRHEYHIFVPLKRLDERLVE